MNAPRATAEDYIDFLIATPRVATATEAARVQPDRPNAPAHDAFTRLLARLGPEPAALWDEVRPHVTRSGGVLVADDTVLDKPYAHKMGLVAPFWSGKHQRVLRGISLVTLAWTDGDAVFPTDYRLVDKAGEPDINKNDHLRAMLATAKARGFAPACVCFDAWYSGLDNLKAVRGHGWHFLTQVRSNRRVNPDRSGNRPIERCDIAPTGTTVHLEGFGLVKAFRIAARDGGTEHWITNDLAMTDLDRLALADRAWQIEEYHRALKQCTEVERCQARLARSQRSHVGLALRAFVRLEYHRFRTGVSWFEAKWGIVRDAVRAYLTRPRYRLPDAASA
jgi:hypothetical protein